MWDCRAVRGLANYMFHEAQRIVKVFASPPPSLLHPLSLTPRLPQSSLPPFLTRPFPPSSLFAPSPPYIVPPPPSFVFGALVLKLPVFSPLSAPSYGGSPWHWRVGGICFLGLMGGRGKSLISVPWGLPSEILLP